MNASSDFDIGIPSSAGGYPVAVRVFGGIFLATAVWLVYMLMTNPAAIPWDFLVVNYIYLLGISQFGVCFVAIMRLSGAKWSRPYHRLGELMTMAYGPFAILGFITIFYFGRHELYYWIGDTSDAHRSAFQEENFLLWRNVIAQLVFYGLAKYHFLLGMIPDIREGDSGKGSALQKLIYRPLEARVRKYDAVTIERKLYYLAPVLLISAAVAQSFIAWDFGMMLVEHYHSTVYPMYFMVGNMFAGAAALFVMLVVLARFVPMDSYFGVDQLRSMGIYLTGFSLLFVYFFWAQFFVSWYGNLQHEYGVISLQMYGHYGSYFWMMLFFLIGVPILSMIFAKVKRMRWSLTIVTSIILIGMWLNRYLMVIPGLRDGDSPFSSMPEVIVAILFLSGFLFVLFWAYRLFPMLSGWQLRDEGAKPNSGIFDS
jgi:molybdopterin-containing oxidoreductase family membrane subunit